MAWRFRWGFHSFRADWKVARDISRDSWGIRNNADVPDRVNKQLENAFAQGFPIRSGKLDKQRFSKQMDETGKVVKKGLDRFRLDFNYVEEIKYNASILESIRVKKLHEFEQLLHRLISIKKIDPQTYNDAMQQINSLKNRLSSKLSDDKEMARRLKGKI